MKIQKLSPLLINQIAAGEVIERPAAVLKECLENSIDAGATALTVAIKQGGLKSIRITDDGCGIAQDDLALALMSHATSKIKHVDDLTAIATLGFRGEALASISAISRFQLISRTADASQAWQINLHVDSDEPVIKPAAHECGTTIEVNDLFFNTPARRKFMRSARTEYLQCEAVVKKIALSHFNVAVKFLHDDKVIFTLPPATTLEQQQKRIAKCFNSQFINAATMIDESASGLHLRGWVAGADFMRSSNDFQYFFLNGRMVRDKLINHAIRQAFEEVLYPGRQPAYCLYFECDAAECDVNVHPTKHEVRFQQSRLIHDFIFRKLHHVVAEPEVPTFTPQRSQSHHQSWNVKEAVAVYGKLIENADHPYGRVIGVLQQRFCLCEDNENAYFIDLLAAEHYLCEQQLQQTSVASRPLLVPANITLTPTQFAVIREQINTLTSLGLQLDEFTDTQVIVRAIPVVLPQLDMVDFLRAIDKQDARTTLIKKLINANDFLIEGLSADKILPELTPQQLPVKNCFGKSIIKITPLAKLESLLDG